MNTEPQQTDLVRYIDRAWKTTNAEEARLLWRKNIPEVRRVLRYRDFHPGIPGWLPHLDVDKIWDEVQEAQKGCRVGLLEKEHVIRYCDEWVWLRSWLVENDKAFGFLLSLEGRRVQNPGKGRDATVIYLSEAGLAICRGHASKDSWDIKDPILQGCVRIKSRDLSRYKAPGPDWTSAESSFLINEFLNCME